MPAFTAMLIFVAAIIFPQLASGNKKICPNQPEVTVLSSDSAITHTICNASEKAISTLSSYGLSPKRQIVIQVIEESIDSHGYLAYGSYNSRSDKISLMSYPAILENNAHPEMYDEYFDHVHYTGAIAHEITHAVFHQHSRGVPPGTAHQEYLAHAIQLAVLPEERRNRIIGCMDVSPWESGDAISDVYMALQPGRFAVKSYLHLTTAKDPRAFIDILLNSKWFYVYIP